MIRKVASLTVLALGLAACADTPTAANAPVTRPTSTGTGATALEPIPGEYIVVLQDGVRDPKSRALEIAATYGGTIRHVYTRAVHGFSISIPDDAAYGIRNEPDVTRIEQDQVMRLDATQSGATWGIDRVDQRALPLSGTYTYANTGAGVHAYIIDTGIRFDHTEFGGRASSGYDAVDGGSADDCNGHGTHVSGTVGGSTYGIAKSVSLVAVRVLDCSGSGTTSGVIAGIDWVTANAIKPAVANMSLGGGASTTLDDAVRRSIAAGVTYGIAAGNGNKGGRAQDACGGSPSRVLEAIVVGATDKTDTKTSWSNYGTCLDIFAPGLSITSSWYTSSTATNTISGTSMATPHVVGVAALYLQSNPGASPSAVRNALVANGTTGVVKSAGTGSPNVLLFSNY